MPARNALRRPLLLALAGVILLTAVFAVARPQVAPAAAATGTGVKFGVHMWGAQESDSALDLVAQTGATLVPVFIPWRDVEAVPGVRVWSSVDAQVDAITARGLTPYFIIGATPPWASDGVKGVVLAEKMTEWGNFVGAVVDRYGDRTTYFSFFNEPDCVGLGTYHGNCWNLHPDRYVETLRVAREAVKARRPAAYVISGGLAGEVFNGNFDPNFLENILKAGVGQHIDLLDMHYYPAFRSTWESQGTDVLGKVNAYRALLDQYGATNVRLVMSEISHPAGRDNLGIRHPTMSVEQFRYLPQGLSRGAAGNLEAIIWYTLADNGPNDYGITIAQANGSVAATDSFTGFKTATSLLKNASPAGTLALGAGVEGYAFTTATGASLWVIWTTDGNTRPVGVPARQVRLTTLRGAASTLSGDNVVSVSAGPEASFVEITQGPDGTTTYAVYLPSITRGNLLGW